MIIVLALLQLANSNPAGLGTTGTRSVWTTKQTSAAGKSVPRQQSRTSPMRARVETRINNRVGGNQRPVEARPSAASAYPYGGKQ